MNRLNEIYENSKSAVLGIHVLDKKKDCIIGSGTGFILENHLITNFHVIDMILEDVDSGKNKLDVIISYANTGHRKQHNKTELINISKSSSKDFSRHVLTSSEQNGYDFAILDKAGIANLADSSLKRGDADKLSVGDEVVFLGYPFGFFNITLHTGIISSIYDSGIAKIFQLDASTNNGNSGGPVLDVETGEVVGIVTRKADGLTKSFTQLKEALKSNAVMLSNQIGKVRMAGVDTFEAMAVQQQQLHRICKEIERSANVGIGYAHTITPIIQEIDRLTANGDI